MRPDRQFLLKHPAHFLALGFGAGLATRAPGTWGTLVALPFYLLANALGGASAVLLLAVIFFVVGVWAAALTGRALGVADHGGIVIDEIAAFLLVLALTPPGWPWVGVAFLLFRLFDIAKPWPIYIADKHIKGGFGVMFDDILAAAYAVAGVLLLRQIFPGAQT
ncbi:MAG TPA: phosphatidylglycerophosphatase A [Usitatibacteraceae bacterium]